MISFSSSSMVSFIDKISELEVLFGISCVIIIIILQMWRIDWLHNFSQILAKQGFN